MNKSVKGGEKLEGEESLNGGCGQEIGLRKDMKRKKGKGGEAASHCHDIPHRGPFRTPGEIQSSFSIFILHRFSFQTNLY